MRKIVLAATLGLLVTAGTAHAGAIIADGNVGLGVHDFGNLNVRLGDNAGDLDLPPSPSTSVVGVRFLPTNNESTAPGCLCEGWGIGIADGTGTSIAGGNGVSRGYANRAVGTAGLVVDSFAFTATTATSITSLSGNSDVTITHAFALASETDDLYRVTVTITNGSNAEIAQLLYRRVMDWDVDPNAFREFVTIQGTAAATAVVGATDDGFESADPFSGNTPINPAGVGDFVDVGPQDHGAAFDFDFGALAAGESFSFDIFYGGSATERGAIAALAAVGAEVYSLGQHSGDPLGLGLPDGAGRATNTFIFGFSGVGGTVVTEVVPEPSTMALFGLGMLGLVGAVRRRRKQQVVTETA